MEPMKWVMLVGVAGRTVGMGRACRGDLEEGKEKESYHIHIQCYFFPSSPRESPKTIARFRFGSASNPT